uniref:Putative ovule protein n=1 Tax=Solanum chacoense TaxID=4108 RepID=A0A0V0GEL7_SOLCH
MSVLHQLSKDCKCFSKCKKSKYARYQLVLCVPIEKFWSGRHKISSENLMPEKKKEQKRMRGATFPL